ncbi:methyl-accepting chemotaxis sensory transducer with Cache sensor [Arsukibacterium tuosuense]|uniref:Methyl-accepting chemotaxis sensory transducer with Cache sensor n=1 Tax=Arsukibacterium tuosuense TaxID=1323745 RepID=A0A285ICV6_9GAMM|nr:methyl-accepting chemotaxis protein [Arsukibacterium tuosuense]SNY45763.1 methyl-accepting chemotaxis sensory transducer with Cache sensor [Arsukibacterium tuosuense]
MSFWNTVGGRLLSMPLLALVGFLVLAAVALNALNNSLIEGREDRVVAVIDSGMSLIRHYQALEQSGAISTEQAQQQAMAAIRAIRYDGTEYIWINDTGRPIPTMVMHPTVPSLDGTVLDRPNFNYATLMRNRDGSEQQPLDNANLFVSFVDVIGRYGDGFVEYQWTKPLAGGGVTEERYTKLSYVAKDDKWGWVLGSGIYIDDVKAAFWGIAAQVGVLVFIVIALTVGISLYIRRWLLRALGGEVASTKQLVQQVAAGDFSVNLALRPGDNDSLLAALSGLINQLRQIIGQQSAMAEQLAAQSQTLDETSQQTQHILQSVMDQTAQVATAVHQMTATCEDMARSATTAAKAARDADDEARNGVTAVEQTITAIDALKLKLEQVADVIGQLSKRGEEVGAVTDVIGAIAEQTNLLALNAAIEAARAGEMGRGFAVVADEVRTLASRSQASTQDINQRIQGIQQDSANAVDSMAQSKTETEQTIACSQQASAALKRINTAVSSITDVNDQLASATEELAAVSGTINQNMENIADAVQSTTEKSAELSVSSQQLRQMATDMKKSLSSFTL